MKKKFGLIGAAGFVAPRHMRAIKDTGNILQAAYDPNDSVGIIDTYFPSSDFFTDSADFEHAIERENRSEVPVEFISICSPNYLHEHHIKIGLQLGCHVICEKPLVANLEAITRLENLEKQYRKRIFTILQLRYHPEILRLKRDMQSTATSRYDVSLDYITPRGKWYLNSWKGDPNKSYGILYNIGIHLFDVLNFLFGNVTDSDLFYETQTKAAGVLEFESATIKWQLSIESEDLPSSQSLTRQSRGK